MDQSSRYADDGLKDSLAARVKTRARQTRKDSRDNEARAAMKSRHRKKGSVEANLGAQEGSNGDLLGFSFATYADADINPPQTPLFGFGGPQVLWQEASQSQLWPNSSEYRPHPASFYLPCLPYDDPKLRRELFGPPSVAPTRSHNGSEYSMNNTEPLGVDKQHSFASTNEPDTSVEDWIEPDTSGFASNATPLQFTNGLHHMSDSSLNSMMQTPASWELQINGTSSGSPRRPLSYTNGLFTSPDRTSLSSITSPATTINGSTGSSKMAFHGLQAAAIIEWQPARLLCMDNEEPENHYALLVLNQPIQNLNMLRLIWKKAFFRIAADGGANRLAEAFKDPCLNDDFEKTGLEVICGDLDSLYNRVREDAKARGTKIVEDPDQYSTDFTKSVNYLRTFVFPVRRVSPNIVCLGGLGGRVDQGLSQLHHLYMAQQHPEYKDGRVYLLSTEALTFVLKTGRHRIRVHDPNAPILGKHIGIIPLKEPAIITTQGLEWDVSDWRTEFGGQISTSNHVREDVVEITTTGDVLFTIDLDFPAGNHEHPELRRQASPTYY